MKEFTDLPFNERPDLTPFLVHLTKDLQSLKSILEDRTIKASDKYIQGSHDVVSFMDVPFYSLKYVLNKKNRKRYGPYGIIVRKKFAYKKNVRPVLHLSDQEVEESIPPASGWYVEFGPHRGPIYCDS